MEFNVVDLTTENQTRLIRKTAPNHKIERVELADYEAGSRDQSEQSMEISRRNNEKSSTVTSVANKLT